MDEQTGRPADGPVGWVETPIQKIGARVEVTPRHAKRMAAQPPNGPATRAVPRLLQICLGRYLKQSGLQPMGPIEMQYQRHMIRPGGIAVAYVRGIAWPGPLPEDLAHYVPPDGASITVLRSDLP